MPLNPAASFSQLLLTQAFGLWSSEGSSTYPSKNGNEIVPSCLPQNSSLGIDSHADKQSGDGKTERLAEGIIPL